MTELQIINQARLDRWLWAARIFKTRTIAANACKNNRVMRDNVPLKPSSTVKIGDVISVRKPPVVYSFKILNCIEQRVGAKLIPQVYENVTDAKQYELLEMARISGFIDRAKGTGRPTKKDRRALDNFAEPIILGFDDDDDFDDFDFDE
jgi:ribosome-associated heat shock protein Hsp15